MQKGRTVLHYARRWAGPSLVYQMSFNPHLGIILTLQIRTLRLRRVHNLCKITAIKARRKIQTHIHWVPILGISTLIVLPLLCSQRQVRANDSEDLVTRSVKVFSELLGSAQTLEDIIVRNPKGLFPFSQCPRILCVLDLTLVWVAKDPAPRHNIIWKQKV